MLLLMTQDVDMNTVEIPQLDFLSSFEMKVDESEGAYVLHGFVAYFDVGFEADCTTPVIIPTGTLSIFHFSARYRA